MTPNFYFRNWLGMMSAFFTQTAGKMFRFFVKTFFSKSLKYRASTQSSRLSIDFWPCPITWTAHGQLTRPWPYARISQSATVPEVSETCVAVGSYWEPCSSANIDSFARNCPQMALKCQNHDREWMAHESRMMKLTRRQVFGEWVMTWDFHGQIAVKCGVFTRSLHELSEITTAPWFCDQNSRVP